MKPIIFGSHLGNFALASDPLWLGWRKDDGRIDLTICDNDLREAANAGANATRLFKPTFELKVGDNLWDPSRFNMAEFEDTRGVIAVCHDRHIKPYVTLFFNHGKGPWTFNVQGLKDPYSSVPLSEAYVERVVAELGHDIGYEIICEPYYKGKWSDKDFMKPGSSWYWLGKMIEKLWACGVPAENIIYGPELKYTWDNAAKTFKIDTLHADFPQAAEVVRVDLIKQGFTKDAINKKLNDGWQTQHNCGRAPEVMDHIAFPNGFDNQFCIDVWGKETSLRRCMVSDDGAPQGEPYVAHPQPDGRWPRPTPAQEYSAAVGLLRQPFPKGLAIEVLGYKHNGEIYEQLKAVSQAVKDATGEWPENYGKFPKPVEPEPDPGTPQPKPKTEGGGVNWRGEWANNKWLIIGGTIALIVAAILIF